MFAGAEFPNDANHDRCFASADDDPHENTTDDHGGALLVPGQAIALLYKWLGRIERGDQAVNLASAITWFASSCYGAVELDDNKGVSIITDHV